MPIEGKALDTIPTLLKQITKLEKDLQQIAKQIKTRPTKRDLFLSDVREIVKQQHPKKILEDDEKLTQQWEKYIKSIDVNSVGFQLKSTDDAVKCFTSKMQKVRKVIQEKDYSQITEYKKKLQSIAKTEFKNLLCQDRINIEEEIELLLSTCEYDFIDKDIELKSKFVTELQKILKKYKCSIADDAFSQIISLGEAISQHSQHLTGVFVNEEFQSEAELNRTKISGFVTSSIINANQFLTLFKTIERYVQIQYPTKHIVSSLNDLSQNEEIIIKRMREYFTNIPTEALPNIKLITGISAKEIADLMIDFLCNFKKEYYRISHLDVRNLFYE
ncbi:hypothetical protein AB837_00423 [bacterium AB1]|nr:hypothetical protein AB837_00423 [bacterium AB1]